MLIYSDVYFIFFVNWLNDCDFNYLDCYFKVILLNKGLVFFIKFFDVGSFVS